MTIYVDGSCSGNPGPGGYGIVGFDDNGKLSFCEQRRFDKTTNNQMELMACLCVLEVFGTHTPTVTVYSDSLYAINTLTNWKNNWKLNGWLRSNGAVPENLQIIQKYDILEEKGYKIDLQKIGGHRGILGNEIADALATGRMTEKEVIERYG